MVVCKEFSCINAVQNRACRFFLGVGKYAPNNGVSGDMGWKPVCEKQWKCVLLIIGCADSRFRVMDNSRINKVVYEWMCNKRSKQWKSRLTKQIEQFSINEDDPNACKLLEERMFQNYKDEWKNKINDGTGPRPNQRNKLRTYKLFKEEYGAESYVTCVMPRSYRSALAKFRCGVAPLRIETGRYERVSLDERRCFHCKDFIEDELHVLTVCPLYQDLRDELYNKASSIKQSFTDLTDTDKMCFILSSSQIVKYTAKTCYNILVRRRNCIYNNVR